VFCLHAYWSLHLFLGPPSFFCRLQYILTLTWQYVYRSFIINFVYTCFCNSFNFMQIVYIFSSRMSLFVPFSYKWKANPLQALRVPGGWGSQISRQSANEGGKSYAPAAFTPRKYPCYSFLLETESTPGP
jgi:hypothetical protein